MKKLSGEQFDSAILGVLRRCGQEDIIVYDENQVIDILINDDEMTAEEAVEYYEFNILGAWVGDDTPGFLGEFSEDDDGE
jgi:hypothetical protein